MSDDSSKPSKPMNYFILSDIHPSMTWRQSFGWMLSRIILLLQKMSILQKDLWTRCRYLERKDNLPCTNPRHWRPYWNPKRVDHHPIFCHPMPQWHESQWHFILDYHLQESDVSNCTIRPTSPHKRLPQMFATSAPNLHPRRIMSYYHSLWQRISPPNGPFSSWIWNSSELCKSARACPGSRAQQSSY